MLKSFFPVCGNVSINSVIYCFNFSTCRGLIIPLLGSKACLNPSEISALVTLGTDWVAKKYNNLEIKSSFPDTAYLNADLSMLVCALRKSLTGSVNTFLIFKEKDEI